MSTHIGARHSLFDYPCYTFIWCVVHGVS